MNRVLVSVLSITAVIALPVQGAVDSGTALDAHNQVRSTLNQGGYAGQPLPDPPLPLMMWDSGLAASATAYAQQCIWAHSDGRINTGENLYASTGLDSDVVDAVEAWADEYRFYDFASGGCTPGEQCGHYTQLIWEGSILVGCGDAVCAPLTLPGGSVLFDSGRIQVCHYATAGNVGDHAPYETDGGTPSLIPTYSATTGEVTLPYGLIWQPTNLVRPTTAALSLHTAPPPTFSLDSYTDTPYRPEEEHVPIYDVNSRRLLLPHVDAYIGGHWGRYSAVLKYVPGSLSPRLMQLEQFR